MANISSAFGTVTITADSKETLTNLIYLHNQYEQNVYYTTTFSDIKSTDYQQIKNYVDQNTSDTAITLDFEGQGRWSFSTNLLWFFNCLDIRDWSDGQLNNSEYSADAQEMAKTLATKTIRLDWDVTDSESGCSFITKYQQSFEWNPNQQKPIELLFVTEHDDSYNATDLIAFDIYDKGDVWDVPYVLNNYDYFLNEIHYWLNTEFTTKLLENPLKFKQFLQTIDDTTVYYDLDDFLTCIADEYDLPF